MKILIADDDGSVRMGTAMFLEGCGHTTAEVVDGVHVLPFLEAANGFELVVTDYQMPRMHGIEVLRCIRASVRFTDLPVIVFSGRPIEKEVASLKGFYVQKPDYDRLHEIIKSLVH